MSTMKSGAISMVIMVEEDYANQQHKQMCQRDLCPRKVNNNNSRILIKELGSITNFSDGKHKTKPSCQISTKRK